MPPVGSINNDPDEIKQDNGLSHKLPIFNLGAGVFNIHSHEASVKTSLTEACDGKPIS